MSTAVIPEKTVTELMRLILLARASRAGSGAARPGSTCRDLFMATSAVISEMDQSGGDIGRFGHGFGVLLAEQPSHAAFDRTVLSFSS